MELSDGYKIRKPHPEKSLKIRDKFILTADLDDADISPKVWFEILLNSCSVLLYFEQENMTKRSNCIFTCMF